jgi:transcriptional regulator with XRE-family HTH domain
MATKGQSDEKWFKTQMQSAGLSQRQLAEMMELDHSALSRCFTGERKMSTYEAAMLATYLNSTISEVVAHSIGEPVQVKGAIPVVFSRHENVLQAKPDNSDLAPIVVLPENCVAARDENPQSLQYGWTYFFQQSSEISPDAIGRLSVVADEAGDTYLVTLRRGFKPGEYHFIDGKGETTSSSTVKSATPIIAIQT